MANPPNTFEVISTIATLIALGIASWQSVLARKSLEAAKESIDEDKRSRQLQAIPKISWIIEVDMHLERWIKDIDKMKMQTANAYLKRDEALLKEVAQGALDNPKKIGIDSYTYEHLPDNLRIILMSGAQYFYNATAAARAMWKEEKQEPWWEYSLSMLARFQESHVALMDLKKLTNQMIPEVLLQTPASLNDQDFIK